MSGQEEGAPDQVLLQVFSVHHQRVGLRQRLAREASPQLRAVAQDELAARHIVVYINLQAHPVGATRHYSDRTDNFVGKLVTGPTTPTGSSAEEDPIQLSDLAKIQKIQCC